MEHMSAEKRAKHFKEHYAHGGREMPKPCGRGAERKGGKAEMWDRELGRDATHSKG
jgi:hypothetical protein